MRQEYDCISPAGAFASEILSGIGIAEQDCVTYAAAVLKWLLSRQRLSPAVRRGPPSSSGAFFVDARDGSGRAVKLLGIGASEKTAVLDACGYLLTSSGIHCPEALAAELDLSPWLAAEAFS